MNWRAWLAAVIIILLAWATARRRLPADPAQVPGTAQAADTANASLLASRAPLSSEEAVVLCLDGRPTLAAARVLEAAGVPYAVTADLEEALRHRFILLPLDDRAAPLDEKTSGAITAWLKNGGTLVMPSPAGGSLWREITSLTMSLPSRSRRRILWLADRQTASFLAPREIPLAGPSERESIWTTGLRPARGQAETLAVFDDHEAAILMRRVGAGRVYVLGAALSDLHLRAQAGRHFGLPPDAAAAEVWPALLGAWAESACETFLRAEETPAGADAVLAVSHDLEGSEASREGARTLAAFEKARGVNATWFIRADLRQLGTAWSSLLKSLTETGAEVASGGVCAAPDLDSLPFGDGREEKQSYHPKLDGERSQDASLLGETRVSRQLLKTMADIEPAGFRGTPGSWPQALDLALFQAGYLYDATLSLALTQSRHPYLLPSRRGFARESPIVEVPVSFDGTDPRSPATAAMVLSALRAAPGRKEIVSWKVPASRQGLAALQEVLPRLPAGTTTRTHRQLALWRLARARTRFYLEPGMGRRRTLIIRLPPGGAAELSLRTKPLTRSCTVLQAPEGTDISCQAGRVLVSSASEGLVRVRLEFE